MLLVDRIGFYAPIWGYFFVLIIFMLGFVIGRKSGMSQRFSDLQVRVPTTTIDTASCYLTDIKEKEKHGYIALELGFGAMKSVKKSIAGKSKKAGIEAPLRFFKEFRLEKYGDSVSLINQNGKVGLKIGERELYVGDLVKSADFFVKGEKVTVQGISKGKGFQGVVKRHGFAGGPRTHGQSDRERAPGSIGQTTTPGRVYRGKRMAGHMGYQTITVKGLEVIDVTESTLTVKGAIPGSAGTLVSISTPAHLK